MIAVQVTTAVFDGLAGEDRMVLSYVPRRPVRFDPRGVAEVVGLTPGDLVHVVLLSWRPCTDDPRRRAVATGSDTLIGTGTTRGRSCLHRRHQLVMWDAENADRGRAGQARSAPRVAGAGTRGPRRTGWWHPVPSRA